MKIIMSDAKKMKVCDDHGFVLTTPVFQREADEIWQKLESMSQQELMDLYHCSLSTLMPVWNELERSRKGQPLVLSPALLSYDGIAFSYLAANVFIDQQWEYVNNHLRIMSGLYGILRPLDGVHPYRLEMASKWEPSLYDLWSNKLAEDLNDDVIINLASKEYSKAVSPYIRLIDVRFFEEDEDGKRREKGVYAKIARGTMIAWMAKNQIENPEDLVKFNELGYEYDHYNSHPYKYVFVRKESHDKSDHKSRVRG